MPLFHFCCGDRQQYCLEHKSINELRYICCADAAEIMYDCACAHCAVHSGPLSMDIA